MSSELEYYKQQLEQSEALLAESPESSELTEVVKHLREAVRLIEDTAVSTVEPSKPAENTHIGRTAEVFFDNKWFNAEIYSIRVDDMGAERVIVKFIGNDNAREYGLSDIKLLPWASKQDFPEGTKVQAIWKEDGLWYNGSIRGDNTDVVLFVEFDGFEGEPEPVKYDQVRLPVARAPRPVPPPGEEKVYVTPAGYKIPEKLKIDPTRDSEKVIAEKKRKIHHIKSQQRGENYSEQITHNKSKWQQFQQKGMPKTSKDDSYAEI